MANVIWAPNTKDAVDGMHVGVNHSLLTKSILTAFLVNADAVEAGSTAEIIVATANNARKGDLIRFTSGVFTGYEVGVKSLIDANTFKIDAMPAAPSAADTFDILRFRTPLVDINGNILVSAGAAAGSSYVDSIVTDYGPTPVTAGAWVQVIAALPAAANRVEIFDSSGEIMELGVGGVGVESRVTVIQPGGNGQVALAFAIGSRISLRAVTANGLPTPGSQVALNYNILTFYS